MKNLIFKLAVVFGIIFLLTLIYQYKLNISTESPNVTVTKSQTKHITPLSYTGSNLLNKFNKTTIDNYPTAAGTFDLATMASQITSQLTQAFSNAAGRPLPLVANWNVGIPEYSDGLDPMYMINRLANGEHIVPTWKLDPYFNDTIGLSYYEASIKKAAELGLPLVFILPSPESALTNDDVYFSMDKTNNPNVITTNGTVLPKLSPFGPNNLWNEVGEQWSTTSLMAQLQEWYPNPPLVLFIDEDRSSKLLWSDLNSSSRYQTQYPVDGTDEFKRTLVNAQWVEKYRQLHKGFRDGFTNDNWKQNSKFISRNQLAANMGTTSEWQKSATTTNLHANIWPLTADGLTVDVALDGNKTLLNNLPFMLDEAKNINPNFVTQLSIDAYQNITNANKYRGYTQLALWLLRPNIIRQTSHETTKADINPLFQEVVDSVELINGSDILADFWKNGKLVKTGDSKYNTNVPAVYQAVPREFFLQTDASSPVYAFALEKGVAPNREWLIYAQSPEGDLSDVTLTVPGVGDILVNASKNGSFYIINESKPQQASTIITQKTNITLSILSVQATNVTTNTVDVKWNLTDYATGQVEYGISTDYGHYSSAEESLKYKTHKQTLKNLIPNTIYHYRVISTDKNNNKVLSEDFTFQTLKNAYYVSNNGNDSNDGKTEQTAWLHISTAAEKAKAGDIVYIKAGEYPKENIIVKNSGTIDQPIVFEGYSTTPHDNPILKWNYSDNNLTLGLNASIMPLLDGINRGNGNAISINNKQNIIFRNLQIKNYLQGVVIQGTQASNNILHNIITENFGDLNADYAGNAIVITGNAHNNKIENSIVLNAGAQAFTIVGNDNTINNSKAYANDGQTGIKSATDYYFVIVGDNNKVLNSYAERKTGLAHGGHGFSIKFHGEHNLIKNCATKNISGSFEFRHSGVLYNTFEDINATGTGDKNTFGVTFRDGTSHNTVNRYFAKGINHAITFRETTEDGANEYSGRDNIIQNSKFEDIISSFIIFYQPKGDGKGKSLNNIFSNVTFDATNTNAALFETLYDQQDNTFENCTFINIPSYSLKLMTPGKETFINSKTMNLEFTLPLTNQP